MSAKNSINCEECVMRLFDEDCRQQNALPTDVQMHLDGCAECAQLQKENTNLDALMRHGLRTDPPAHVYRRALHAVVAVDDSVQERSQWLQTISLALLAGALCGTLFAMIPPLQAYPFLPVLMFFVAAAIVGLQQTWQDLNAETLP